VGRSAWNATEEGLVHRADPTVQAAFELASSIPGSVSTELKEAWDKAHARQSNPGDAWDQAIKAVEAVLIPLVVPTQTKPNLGHVLGSPAVPGSGTVHVCSSFAQRIWKGSRITAPRCHWRGSMSLMASTVAVVASPGQPGQPAARGVPAYRGKPQVTPLPGQPGQFLARGEVLARDTARHARATGAGVRPFRAGCG
jgi:hypothetical protein